MDNTVMKSIPYGSYEYWYDYLNRYMVNHHFVVDDDTVEDMESIAQSATAIYNSERESGNAMGAGELAVQRLFSSIGDSEYEVIENILEDYFYDSIDVSDTRWIGFWTDTLSEIPGIFDNCRREWGYGLDPEKVEDNISDIVETIRTFFTQNGLQPSSETK